MERVIHIENLGKRYLTGEIKGSFLRGKGVSRTEIWAVNDLDFTLRKGEVVGIIGKNGAGKSTLLKLLSQITAPSKGRFRVKGTISSLLEVGTGMHPELTGSENIFLNGAILGMSKARVSEKFDDIVAFSECGAFIDTPLKRYSSGMKVRLGFAVAAFLNSDILIIDEVLAVGDAQFQAKATKKITEMVSQGDRSVLFVSHNMAAVKSICSRCIVLDSGKKVFDGEVDAAISMYLGYDTTQSESYRKWTPETAPGNDDYKLVEAEVSSPEKDIDTPLSVSDSFDIKLKFLNLNGVGRIDCTLQLHSEDGVFLAASSTFQLPDTAFTVADDDGVTGFRCSLPGNVFNQGVYRISVLLVENQKSVVARFDNLFTIGFTAAVRDVNSWMGKSGAYFVAELDWGIAASDKL